MSEGKPSEPGDGIRGVKTTGVFRAVNFELFAKPVSSTILSNLNVGHFGGTCLEEVCDDHRWCVHYILHGFPVFLEPGTQQSTQDGGSSRGQQRNSKNQMGEVTFQLCINFMTASTLISKVKESECT